MTFALEKKLGILFCLALLAYFLVNSFAERGTLRYDEPGMREATALAGRWFSIIEEEKMLRGISSNSGGISPHSQLIGDEYSDITTTLGVLDAKHTALNPEFAALFVRMLHDAGISSGNVVGLSLSGSFPSLSISMLAALQTIGAEGAIISSLGASSFGANQPAMTWIDMESTLRREGGLKYRSEMVTLGAESDTGGGLSEQGIALLEAAARRNGIALFHPRDFEDAVRQRVDFFVSHRTVLLVNIGGNHAMMGNCVHSSMIPNDYHRVLRTCLHNDRGAIYRLNERGIPLLHILNIRSLAVAHGLPLEPNGYAESPQLHRTKKADKALVLALTTILCAAMFILFRRKPDGREMK
ncbi:MAG: poly-gamma-glutamate system protein [Ignavibacteriales bacterium]|nr:poly-gamma-glutamate system protein [Ignavibacteriales bacterium]